MFTFVLPHLIGDAALLFLSNKFEMCVVAGRRRSSEPCLLQEAISRVTVWPSTRRYRSCTVAVKGRVPVFEFDVACTWVTLMGPWLPSSLTLICPLVNDEQWSLMATIINKFMPLNTLRKYFKPLVFSQVEWSGCQEVKWSFTFFIICPDKCACVNLNKEFFFLFFETWHRFRVHVHWLTTGEGVLFLKAVSTSDIRGNCYWLCSPTFEFFHSNLFIAVLHCLLLILLLVLHFLVISVRVSLALG